MKDEIRCDSFEPGSASDLSSDKTKVGRIGGKNSEHRSGGAFISKKLLHQIEMVLNENSDKAAHKKKKVGSGTQSKRRTVIKGFFCDLLYLKFKIESIYNLKEKHLIAVFNFLEKQGQSPATIQNKISIMRVFCKWIGKDGMVRDSILYVKNKASVRRSTVVQEDKSWTGNGVDVLLLLAVITAKDKVVAMWLELCWAFGLRISESVMLKPAMSHEGDFVWIREATKGGRPRVIPIENEIQRDVLQRAKQLGDGKTGFLGKRGKSMKSKRRRIYTVMESLGITLKDCGISAHGLRHEYMQESFKRLLGIDAPIKGGDLSQLEKTKLNVASLKLAERAGHSRASIGAAYYGSRAIRKANTGHDKTTKEMGNEF